MAKKILLVDDDFNMLKLISSRLKAGGYEVITASDSIQAVTKAHQEKPDLIILDMRMPAGGGKTVYDNLKVSTKTSLIPVIFITAYPSDEMRQKVMNMGAEDFITKPFKPEELLSKVKKVLGE